MIIEDGPETQADRTELKQIGNLCNTGVPRKNSVFNLVN